MDGQFIVNIWPSKNVTAQYVEKLYEHWLIKIARPVLKNKVETYSEKLGISKPEKIVIKRLKNKSGSIGKNGDTINLNVNLVKAPRRCCKLHNFALDVPHESKGTFVSLLGFVT
jgi:predicted metal-dependent hydrolase